jgi:hypothetical protein
MLADISQFSLDLQIAVSNAHLRTREYDPKQHRRLRLFLC